MTVANLVGFRLEPAGAYIQLALYLFLIALFDALVILSVLVWVPNLHDASEIKLTEQFHFLKTGTVADFRCHHVWQRWRFCVVQFCEAVYGQCLWLLRGVDDDHHDVDGLRHGAG